MSVIPNLGDIGYVSPSVRMVSKGINWGAIILGVILVGFAYYIFSLIFLTDWTNKNEIEQSMIAEALPKGR